MKTLLTLGVPIYNPSSVDLESFISSTIPFLSYFNGSVIFCSYPHYLPSIDLAINRLVQPSLRSRYSQISTSTKGIFHAQNLIGKRCTSDFLIFMGVDDRINMRTPLEFNSLTAALLSSSSDLTFLPYKASNKIYKPRVTLITRFVDTIHQQGVIYRQHLFLSGDYFNPSLPFYANFLDSYLVARKKISFSFAPLQSPFIHFGLNGITGTTRFYFFKCLSEYLQIFNEYEPPIQATLSSLVCVILLFMRQVISLVRSFITHHIS